ncbi:hypothetical protein JTB14_027531 [Gonioctena quinquepunctata]|nr:hypothetical protein JTB14_027531 [Gonioctena quinquepunctata]
MRTPIYKEHNRSIGFLNSWQLQTAEKLSNKRNIHWENSRKRVPATTWSLILGEVYEGNPRILSHIVQDYFMDRSIKAGEEILTVTQEVPQGSILGPEQRNLLYNGVLEVDLTEGGKSISYADDLAS